MKLRKPRGFWTLKECKKEAKKHKSISEWKKNSGSSYVRSRKMGWKFLCVKHMQPLGSKHKRLVYVYEFPDKSIYVGLTYNAVVRKHDHLNNTKKRIYSSVYKYIKKSKLKPIYLEISGYIDSTKASKLEIKTIDKYRKVGYNILNKKFGGSLGGNIIKWTKDNCIGDAKKYLSRSEWNKNSVGAFSSARKNGWLYDCCSHMKIYSKPHNYWTKERCLQERKKYGMKWSKKSHSSYVIASRNNWF